MDIVREAPGALQNHRSNSPISLLQSALSLYNNRPHSGFRLNFVYTRCFALIHTAVTMAYFLAKTDPETYTIDQLEQDKHTDWDGVTNAQAVNAIKLMRPGDKVFIYHSGGESSIRGLAKVTSAPRPDPKLPKSYIAGFQFLKRLAPPTTLAEVKQSELFGQWALVRNSRLSTMAAPDEFVEWMRRRYPKAKI